MKVNFKDSKVIFGTLKIGETFIDSEYDNEAVIIKVAPCGDVCMTGEADLIDNEFDGYGVDPCTGMVAGYYNDDEVVPVKAEVTVFRS